MSVIVSVRPSGSISVVELDDGTSFKCARDFARQARIARGQQIEPVLVQRLRESASLDLARSQAERLVRRGRYCRKEIAVRLLRVGIPQRAITEALDRLVEDGALDDQAVALEIARRSLSRALRQDPDLSWSRFRTLHVRRLTLRGFRSADAVTALRLAWSEFDRSPLAQDRERA